MHRLKVKDLNEQLVCILCDGYLVDATTIIECLHSFCRTCIVRYLENSRFCPVCDVQVHKTKPLQSIKSDNKLQDLVYKLTPGLYQNEMQRRKEFYSEYPEAAAGISSEERGEGTEQRCFYSPQEKISLTLEYFKGSAEPDEPAGSSDDPEKLSLRRHLKCPAAMPVAHLKKFLRMKFSVPPTFSIEIMYGDQLLSDGYTLIDVAYIYSWRRAGPMKFLFTFVESKSIHKRSIDPAPKKAPSATPNVIKPTENNEEMAPSEDMDVDNSETKENGDTEMQVENTNCVAKPKSSEPLFPNDDPVKTEGLSNRDQTSEHDSPSKRHKSEKHNPDSDLQHTNQGQTTESKVDEQNQKSEPSVEIKVEPQSNNQLQQSVSDPKLPTLAPKCESPVQTSEPESPIQVSTKLPVPQKSDSPKPSQIPEAKVMESSPVTNGIKLKLILCPEPTHKTKKSGGRKGGRAPRYKSAPVQRFPRLAPYPSTPPPSPMVGQLMPSMMSVATNGLPTTHVITIPAITTVPVTSNGVQLVAAPPPTVVAATVPLSIAPSTTTVCTVVSDVKPTTPVVVDSPKTPINVASKESLLKSFLCDDLVGVPKKTSSDESSKKASFERNVKNSISAEFSDNDDLGCQPDLVVDEQNSDDDEDLRKKISAIAEEKDDEETDSGRGSTPPPPPPTVPTPTSNKSIDHIINNLLTRKQEGQKKMDPIGALDLSATKTLAATTPPLRAKAVANPVLDFKHRQQTYLPAPKQQLTPNAPLVHKSPHLPVPHFPPYSTSQARYRIPMPLHAHQRGVMPSFPLKTPPLNTYSRLKGAQNSALAATNFTPPFRLQQHRAGSPAPSYKKSSYRVVPR